MMRRLSFIFTILALLFVACNKQQGEDVHAVVRDAASRYCQYLVDGDVDSYVAAIHDADEMPEGFRSQIHDMFRQYLQGEQDAHHGLSAFRVIGDTILDDNRADAFIEVTYGDSTVEQVSLPLLLTKDGWKLK